MNISTFTLENESRQERNEVLTTADRRLLLGASIRLLGHRCTCGKPILRNDILRLTDFADDIATPEVQDV